MNYFPIYLDAAAMHPVLPCAREAFLNAPFGNPSSEHQVGHEARNALESAREKIAALMDCEADEVYFTSTATEAAALAIHSLNEANIIVIPSNAEHHAVTENVPVYTLPRGRTKSSRIAYAQMLVNNETGEIYSERPDYSEYQCGWLCDATAAVGHMPVSFKTLGCDYLIADAIKFGGVPGAAFLIAKKNAPLSPLIKGGGQERGIRSGTENVPAICAMAAALQWQTEHMEVNSMMISALNEIFRNELSKIPKHRWNTPYQNPSAPHILNISFDGVDAHALALLLSKNGVMVSPGAACSNGKNEPSHVIMAMYHDEARARSAIRISLSRDNTIDECVQATSEIKNAVEYLRSLS